MRNRLQQRGAQRRRQHQRDENRQHHRRDDRHRELPVDDAGRAPEERHRHEHRGEHQRDGDQRAGDLIHRFAGGVARRQPFLAHDALDVLDHDDRVVHEQADRQHQREQRQRVDRCSRTPRARRTCRAAPPARRCRESASCASSAGTRTSRGSPARSPRSASRSPARIETRMKRVLSTGNASAMPSGSDAASSVARALTASIVSQRVRAGREAHRHAGGRPAVQAALDLIAVGADLDARDVARRTTAPPSDALQDDVAELLGRAAGGSARSPSRSAAASGTAGCCADLAGRYLGVLRAHRVAHVGRRQVVRHELVGVEPDAHRVGRAEHLHVADAGHARQRILQAAARDSRRCRRWCSAPSCRRGRRSAESSVCDFCTVTPCCSTSCGSRELACCTLFCTCTCAMSGSVPARERRGDLHLPGRTAGRREIQQVVDAGELLLDHLRDGVLRGFG